MFKFLNINERKKKEENGKMKKIERKKYEEKDETNVGNWRKFGATYYVVRLNFNHSF